MSRKRSKRNSIQTEDRARQPAGLPGGESISVPLPSVATRTWVSIWLALHLVALLVSYTSVVEPSGLQAQLTQLAHPYLRPTHFGADDRPVYLAHADPLEQPHRLQVTTASGNIETIDENQWRTVGPLRREQDVTPGMAVSDRAARWLSTVAMLAENEQPSLVAELLLPLVVRDSDVTAIRVMRFPTQLSEVNVEAEAQYVARVVRSGDRVSLVQLRPRRLSSTSITVPPQSESVDKSQSGAEPGAEESVDE